MRNFLFIVSFIFTATACYGKNDLLLTDFQQVSDVWPDGEIVIHIDPSVDAIGDPEKTHGIIEESFMMWIDEMEANITLDFVYTPCTWETGNCVRYEQLIEGKLGNCTREFGYGYINRGRVVISNVYPFRTTENEAGYDLLAVMLHETGHFFGLPHSENVKDIMYSKAHIMQPGQHVELSANDIASIRALY